MGKAFPALTPFQMSPLDLTCSLFRAPLIFCLLPCLAVHQIQVEGLVLIVVLGLDLVHLVVLEEETLQAYLEEESESWEESQQAEGTAARSEGSEAERRLEGKEEMAYRGRQVEEDRPASRKVEEAYLSKLASIKRIWRRRRTRKSSRKRRRKATDARRRL